MKNLIPNLPSMRKINSDNFGSIDYVNFIANIAESPRDVSLSFADLFFPKFELINDMPFNISFGCYEIYKKNINAGMNINDAYYWSHVFDVGESLILSCDDAIVIADKMCIGWNVSLNNLKFEKFRFFRQTEDEILIFPGINTR